MEPDEINRVAAQQMREELSDLLNRAAYLHEPTLVTRQGKPTPVLVSVWDWENYLKLKTTGEEADNVRAGTSLEEEME